MPTWDESKRRRNIRVHGLDFEGEGDMHVISLRKAEPYETRAYLEAAKKFQGEGD